MKASRFRVPLLSAIIWGMFAIGACTSIQLVSNYDGTIDKQAQQLQKELDAYFISLQSAGAEDLKYKNQQKFYEGALVDLDAMWVRAGGIYKNELTIEQIDLAKENLAYLVLLHKQCVSEPLSEEQIKKVKENGIDLSMDCKVENGATSDISGRGEKSINRFVVAPVQSSFNQHLGAIMALELAKKRGKSISDKE
ncbi:MAG: hypothetical protein LJE96_04655 [Deltaproteobacteria bacterium]|nr:hypothetical protein [Deltaproteobacteria bacterium]